jgi:protein-S-isoprenylcysteine O-methyltransferase Ste14
MRFIIGFGVCRILEILRAILRGKDIRCNFVLAAPAQIVVRSFQIVAACGPLIFERDFMRSHPYILLIAASVWLIIEGGLILRDRTSAKGTAKIDRMTRLFNAISIVMALSSPFLSLLSPMLNFGGAEISAITWAGIALMCLGAFLRYWSIIVLGKSFRTTVEIEKGHKIIRKGPYKFIRHPSYGGILLFCAGYGLVSQNWLSILVSVLIPAIPLLYRIRVEEEAFIREIGDEYRNYQSRTKKLIPGIW